jgi:hypothetical protein
MVTELEKQLIQIGQRITDGTASYDDLFTLQSHKREVLEMGDVRLCEQAGITEEEYNKGELNPELSYKEDFIRLEIDQDYEGNAFCTVKLDDNQELTLTQLELLNLKRILDNNITEISEYFERVKAQRIR